jgi:MYXO-CTERM domain-containing protein
MTTDLAEPSNFGRWDLHFDAAGTYLVEVATPAPWAMATQASYQIDHGGQQTAVEVDQSAIDGWTSLGEHAFAAGGGQEIRLDDNTGEANDIGTKLVFDAVRLTRVGGSVDGDPDDGDADDDDDGDGDGDGDGDVSSSGGGCAAGGGGPTGAGLALAAVAALLRHRRRRS